MLNPLDSEIGSVGGHEIGFVALAFGISLAIGMWPNLSNQSEVQDLYELLRWNAFSLDLSMRKSRFVAQSEANTEENGARL